MKRIAMSIAVATLSLTALAAQDFRPRGGGPGGPGGPGGARRIESLRTLLELTAAQVTQATTIFTTADTAVTPLSTNLATARAALANAVKSNSTAIIDQQSTMIGTLTGQITAIRAKADAAFYALLTTAQKTKFDAIGERGGGGERPGPRR